MARIVTPHPRRAVVFEIAAELHRTLASIAGSEQGATHAEFLAALGEVTRSVAYQAVNDERAADLQRGPG